MVDEHTKRLAYQEIICETIRQLGIEIVDNVVITKLFQKDGRVVAASGFHVLNGDFYVLKGKTFILALGREANRASDNSTNNPFNTWGYPYNTGSNNVLAYDVGS